MDSLRHLTKLLFLFLFIRVSSVLAEEPLPSTDEWTPDKVTVNIPSDRQNPYALLRWTRKPIFRSTKERIVLGIEAELVFPELVRTGAERYYPNNRLKVARTLVLPPNCYYQDNYFLDRCENWTLGIDTSPECLLSVLPETVRINYTAAIPSTVATGRYQIQTVGIDAVRTKGFTPLGRMVGPTQEAQIVGEFCSAFCDTCFAAAKIPVVGSDVKELCVATARLKNPYATWDWLEAFCPSCDAARNLSPEWRNFRIDQVQCIEPVAVPGTTTSYRCVRSPYTDGCDPIDYSTPQYICTPGEKRCVHGQREACSTDGLRWEYGFTCGCGCNGNDCGTIHACLPGSTACLDSSRLSTCNADSCGSSVTLCECGCSNDVCRNRVCSSSYCRDAATLIQCIGNGCATQTVTCGYGCSNNRCNDPGGPARDMANSGGSALDMSTSPLSDLSSSPSSEVCDGIDNDKNGIIDDPANCWLSVYRFLDPASGSRCYGTTNVPPPACSSYSLEGVLFAVAAVPWPDGSTSARIQCSKANDHVLTTSGGSEHASLIGAGWSCVQPLGYWFENSRGPNPLTTPFPYRCPVYRARYSLGTGGTAHLFSAQTETLAGTLTCELPTRGEVLKLNACGKPNGC